MSKILNDYEDIDRNMFFKLKEGSRTRGHKAVLVKEQCRLDMRQYSFSHKVINEWNKLSNYYCNASSVNLIKKINLHIYDKGGLHIDGEIDGISISQCLPCPLAICNMQFWMAILLSLVKNITNVIGFAPDSVRCLVCGPSLRHFQAWDYV